MKKISIALAVLVSAAGILGVYLWRDVREQRTLGGELAGRVAALESAPPAVASAPRDESVPETAAAEMIGSPEVAPPPAGSPVEGPKAPAAAMLEAMGGTPEGREFTRSMMRAA